MKRQNEKRLWQFHWELSRRSRATPHPCKDCGEITLVRILAGQTRTLKRRTRALERENRILRAQLQKVHAVADGCLTCDLCRGKGGAP